MEALGKLQPDVDILIYFSGYTTEYGRESFWLPADAAESRAVGWITSESILRRLESLPAVHVLVIADGPNFGGRLAEAADE